MSVPLFGTFFVGASFPIFENNFTRVDATHWVGPLAMQHDLLMRRHCMGALVHLHGLHRSSMWQQP